MALSNWLRGLAFRVVKIGGVEQVSRAGLDLIAGTNVTLVPQDSSAEGALKVTINTIGAGGELPTGGELTIASGAITVTSHVHFVDTESNAAYDELDTISGGAEGDLLILRPVNATRSIIVNHATGNILLHGAKSVVLYDTWASLVLLKAGSSWVELSRTFSRGVNNQADTAHTLLVSDCGRADGVAFTGSSPGELTIDDVASTRYPVGAIVPLTQIGTGAVSVGTTAPATLNGSSGTAVITLNGQNSSVRLWHYASNAWRALGGEYT